MPFIVHCGDCLHQWEPCQLPADVRVVAKAAKKPCQVCGASAKRVFCAPAPTERMETRPAITELQAFRMALDRETQHRIQQLWPSPDNADFCQFALHMWLQITWNADIVMKFIEGARQQIGDDADRFERLYVDALKPILRDPAKEAWRGGDIKELLVDIVRANCDKPGRLDSIRGDLLQGVRWNG